MKTKKIDTIFSESFLKKIPVTYRYMVKSETDDIDELYGEVRFSKSERHQSEQYINFSASKPISNIYLTQMFDTDG